MNIRILQEIDAQSYQELRLNGLKTNPDAFGSTYEREAKFSLETVVERIKPNRDKFVLGVFDDKGMLIGIVAFVRDSGVKTSHKGNVFGMYVKEETRGKGIGKCLMLELIKKAKEIVGLEQINLTVVTNNERAKKLYESVGFEIYGLEHRALKYDGKYLDEDLMVLQINVKQFKDDNDFA